MSGAKCVYVLAVATGLALLVIWQSTLVRSTGYQVAQLEEAVREEISRKHKYKAQITKLKSPKRIFRLMQQLGIPLVSGSSPERSNPAYEQEEEAGQSAPAPHNQPEEGNDEPSMEEAPLSFPSTTARSTAGNRAGTEEANIQEPSETPE